MRSTFRMWTRIGSRPSEGQVAQARSPQRECDIGVNEISLLDQSPVRSCMAAHPDSTFANSGFGVESRLRQKVVEECPTNRDLRAAIRVMQTREATRGSPVRDRHPASLAYILVEERRELKISTTILHSRRTGVYDIIAFPEAHRETQEYRGKSNR